MKVQLATIILVISVLLSSQARAGLFSNKGIQTNKPTVCFVGNAWENQPDRVQDIQNIMSQYEQAGNIRFQYQKTCNKKTINKNDFFSDDIRIVIPNTVYEGKHVFNQLDPVPGEGCSEKGPNSGWSWSPSVIDKTRACLFNLHLGNNSYHSARFGDPSGGATPFINHTLHEVGHALGFSHEHGRFDVNESKVVTYLQQITGVTEFDAKNIYAAGFRSVISVSKAEVKTLQKIQGYSKHEEAISLKNTATKGIKDKSIIVTKYGGGGRYYLTPYDRLSVMHYTFRGLYDFAPGNYSNGGLSKYDRLSIHLLYPEENLIAELAGNRVVRVGEEFHLKLVHALRGAVIDKVLKSITWEVNGFVKSERESLNLLLTKPGSYRLKLNYSDFLDRKFTYSTMLKVLSYNDHKKNIDGPLAAQYSALF